MMPLFDSKWLTNDLPQSWNGVNVSAKEITEQKISTERNIIQISERKSERTVHSTI